MAHLQIQERVENKAFPIKIFSLLGEIDESNQYVLERQLRECLEDQYISHFVFHLGKLDYMNSGVIGIFVSFHEEFTSLDKTFVFSSVHPMLFDIIDHVGLTQVIEVYENDDEACLSFEK